MVFKMPLILLAMVLVTILRRTLHRTIGLYSEGTEGCLILGIRHR